MKTTREEGPNLSKNRSLMQTLTSTMIPPVAAPWMARPAISIAMSFAAAHIDELAAKTTILMSNTSLRPQISDALAQIGDETADVKR